MEHRSARKLDWSAWGHTTVASHEPSRSRRRKGMWREALLRRMLALADSTEALGPVLSLGVAYSALSTRASLSARGLGSPGPHASLRLW
jgi:hypothetical protein